MDLREQSLSPEEMGQDTTLNEGLEALNVSEENVETVETPATKERIVELCAELAEKAAGDISRDEVARLKQQFYAIRKVELDAEKAAFLEKGNEEADFAPMTDELEEKF